MISNFRTKVLKVEKATEDVGIYRLSVPKDFEFSAGQYVLLDFEIDGKKLNRAYSIASSPTEKGYIELCVKKMGHGGVSDKIHELKKNDEIDIRGALGNFVLNESSMKKDLIFIAAGTGVAVFHSMIDFLLETGFNKKIILLKSSRTEKGSLYDDEFLKLQKKYKNFEFYNIFSRPENKSEAPLGVPQIAEYWGNIGHVQDFFEKYILKNFSGNFYLCGLSAMIKESTEKLEKLGFGKESIFVERWD